MAASRFAWRSSAKEKPLSRCSSKMRMDDGSALSLTLPIESNSFMCLMEKLGCTGHGCHASFSSMARRSSMREWCDCLKYASLILLTQLRSVVDEEAPTKQSPICENLLVMPKRPRKDSSFMLLQLRACKNTLIRRCIS